MASTTTDIVGARATASAATRWGQLIFGIICMVMIANLQYGCQDGAGSERSPQG
jgi:OFA family oxalate/formate antiporter-like MFS transporter